MSSTNFISGQTVIEADWLNDVNTITYETTNSVKFYGAVGDGVHNDAPAITAALAASTNKTLIFPPGTYYLGTAVAGNGQQIVAFEPTATTTGSALTGVNSITYQVNANSMVKLRRYVLTPTTIFPTILNITSGKGDNASFIGASGGYFQVRDEPSVDATNKGVLYGLQLSVVPQVPRNNIPYDDVSGLVIQNDATVTNARATDAVYIGRNSSSFTGTNDEWVTGMTIGANCGYGYRVTGSSFTKFDASGAMRGEAGLSYGYLARSVFQSDVTSSGNYFRTEAATAAASFTLINLYHYSATQATFGSGSTVTNQHGFRVSSSLTGGTNNYGFRGEIASGTNRWNLYMSGTANNYLAGKLGIGTNAPTSNLQVTGLPVYANNAAAIAGGLTVGAFYRTGADPDPVCVVH